MKANGGRWSPRVRVDLHGLRRAHASSLARFIVVELVRSTKFALARITSHGIASPRIESGAQYIEVGKRGRDSVVQGIGRQRRLTGKACCNLQSERLAEFGRSGRRLGLGGELALLVAKMRADEVHLDEGLEAARVGPAQLVASHYCAARKAPSATIESRRICVGTRASEVSAELEAATNVRQTYKTVN